MSALYLLLGTGPAAAPPSRPAPCPLPIAFPLRAVPGSWARYAEQRPTGTVAASRALTFDLRVVANERGRLRLSIKVNGEPRDADLITTFAVNPGANEPMVATTAGLYVGEKLVKVVPPPTLEFAVAGKHNYVATEDLAIAGKNVNVRHYSQTTKGGHVAESWLAAHVGPFGLVRAVCHDGARAANPRVLTLVSHGRDAAPVAGGDAPAR